MDAIEGSVSRETIDDLRVFEQLVLKWTVSINLVSRSTQSEIWERHILDSLQLWQHLPPSDLLVDIGSGGGFPGVVLAVCAKHHGRIGKITMIEADIRKCAFLQTAIRSLGLNANVISRRITEVPPLRANLMTARALAPCDQLLGFGAHHLAANGTAFFLKGANAQSEIDEAQTSWHFKVKSHPSQTNADACILEFGDIQRA